MQKQAIARQFHSALKMMDKTIEASPEPLWFAAAGASPNRFWHIAYHAVFYVHLYLAPSEAEFLPGPYERPECRFLGWAPGLPKDLPPAEPPVSQAFMREYVEFCHSEVDLQTVKLDPDAPSGFFWLPFSKLELQFYNLRHLSHHTGQLVERLRAQANISIPWAG